jgi:protease IV
VAYLYRFLINVLRSLLLPFWLVRRWSWSRGEPRFVRVDIHARVVPFRSPRSALERLVPREQRATSLEGLRALADKLGRDRKVRGVLVSVSPLEAGWATCESLREVFQQLRAAGKEVVCYLPHGGGNQELYVALAADRIYVAPFASFGPLGLAAAPLYVRPLLDRLGIRVHALATGQYKTAAEPVLRDSMSDAAREQVGALLAARHEALQAALKRRGLSDAEVSELFGKALVLSDEALAARLVDGVVYEDELDGLLGNASPLPAARYLRSQRPLYRPLTRPQRIAVVPLHGMITGEGGGIGAGLKQSTLTPLLRELAKDPNVRAVVLHIDSPGGSAHASELMHREIKQLAHKKPVVASFGEVAASGGYYLACACNKIVGQALCTTGSIGVVMAKPNAHDFVTKLGLRPQLLRTAESADMLSAVRELSQHEEALLTAHIDQLYQRFLSVAAEGRGRSVEQIDSVARGRVWTGSAARDHGLVDAIGGFERALSEARALVPELSPTERVALEPQVYRLKSQRGAGLRALMLGTWLEPLQELAALHGLQREKALYLAPPLGD